MGLAKDETELRDRLSRYLKVELKRAGVTYAEPFLQKEVGLVDDVTAIPVKSI